MALLKPQRAPRDNKSREIQRTFEDRWSKIDLKDLARKNTQNALDTLIEIMSDTDAPASARLTAANSLLDRGWGKPGQHTQVNVDVYERMSDDELIKFISKSLPNKVLPQMIEYNESDNEDDNEE